MRSLLILLVIGGLGYYGYQRHRAAAEVPVEAPGQYGYAEKRMKISVPNGRELEMVMALERPTDKECADGVPNLPPPAVCNLQGFRCSETALTCTATVPARYAGMLAGQPQQHPYVQLSDRATGRHSVIVAWGTTADEARLLCASQGNGDAQTSIRCL